MMAKDLLGVGATVKTVGDAVRAAVATLYRPTAIRNEGRAGADAAEDSFSSSRCNNKR